MLFLQSKVWAKQHFPNIRHEILPSIYKKPKLCEIRKKTKSKIKISPNLTFKIFHYNFIVFEDFFQDG